MLMFIVCAFAMLLPDAVAVLSEGAFESVLKLFAIHQNVYMHFNGTFEINKYQNKGLYGYGVFLVFPLQVRTVLACTSLKNKNSPRSVCTDQAKEKQNLTQPTKMRRCQNKIFSMKGRDTLRYVCKDGDADSHTSSTFIVSIENGKQIKTATAHYIYTNKCRSEYEKKN